MVLAVPRGAPLRADDLAERPDDGHRYELIDGALVVTPAPSRRHQACLLRLGALLLRASSPGYTVLPAPFDVRLSELTVLQPDLLVARMSDLTEARLEGPPILAVEILSPSTRRIDLGSKRLVFEEAGVPAYWLVDPDGPSLTVLHLEDGRYVEHATVRGDEPYDATRPFPVTIVPSRLVEG